MNKFTKPIPIILDTDIGWDIDDAWAMIMLLNSQELEVRLILTESGNTPMRARVDGASEWQVLLHIVVPLA